MDSSCFIRPFPVIQGCFGSGIPCVVPVSVYHAHHMGRQRQQICTTRVIHCKITHGIAVRTVLRDDMPCKAQLLEICAPHVVGAGHIRKRQPLHTKLHIRLMPALPRGAADRANRTVSHVLAGGIRVIPYEHHDHLSLQPAYGRYRRGKRQEKGKKVRVVFCRTIFLAFLTCARYNKNTPIPFLRSMCSRKEKRHTYTVCLFSALRPSAIFLYAVRRRRFTPSTDTFMRNACSTQLRPRTSHSAIHCASSCGKSKDWIHAIALLGAMLCSIARISRCS
nr:MAG TPA: hypothetical protein [Caudoviricetes sp.]